MMGRGASMGKAMNGVAMGWKAAGFALLAAFVTQSGQSWAEPRCLPPLGSLRYEILNEEAPVGAIHIEVRRDGARLLVRTDVDLEITFLKIPVLSYRHRSEEVWRHGAFEGFEGRTKNNHKRYEVAIRTTATGLRVSRNGKVREIAAPLMSWAIWCEAALATTSIVDTLKGKVKDFEAVFLGLSRLGLKPGEVRARHYRVRRKQRTGEVWYGPDGVVAEAVFPTELGTTARLIRR
jgi:hypothetical protein